MAFFLSKYYILEGMLHVLMDRYHHWRYKNVVLLLVSIAVVVIIIQHPVVMELLQVFGNIPFLGAFIAGLFCASTFTVAPAFIILISLSRHFDPVEIAVMGSVGCTLGDYITTKFIQDEIFKELGPLFSKFKFKKLHYIIHTPYFAWALPVVGAILVAAPGPDEIGLTLMGVNKIKDWQLILTLFIINLVGFFAFVGVFDILFKVR